MHARIPACLVAAASLLCPARAELMVNQANSIFDVDGLLVEDLDTGEGEAGNYFHAEIKKFPLVERRRPPMAGPPPVRTPILAGMPPSGEAMGHLRAAEVFAGQEEWSQALNEIQQGLEIEPGNMLLVSKGAAFAALARKFGVADEYFRRVVEAYPDNIHFLAGRAGVLVRLLRLDEAEDLIQRALGINPEYLAARFDAVCVRIAKGDPEPANEKWDALSLEEATELANWLDADRQDYVSALSETGFSVLCDTVLGKDTHGNLRPVVASFRAARGALERGKWAEAEAALQKARDLGVQAMGVEMTMGRCIYEKGEKELALGMLKDLAARYPRDAGVQYNLAYVLMNLSQYAAAAAALEQAWKSAPEDDQTRFALACAYAGQGQMDRAWPILSRLARLRPEDLRTWMEGDKPYLQAIRKDPRYPDLFSPDALGAASPSP